MRISQSYCLYTARTFEKHVLPVFSKYNLSDIDKLKSDLENYCIEFSITKFEAEDIVELLEDGEQVNWIVDQLISENASIDVEKLNQILSDIKSIVGPGFSTFVNVIPSPPRYLECISLIM